MPFPLVALLLQALPAQHFPVAHRPGIAPLAADVAELCPLASRLGIDALLKLDRRQADSLRGHASDVALWQHLACSRAALAGDGAIAREEIELPVGSSWFQGTANAALRIIALRPTDSLATSLLALVSVDDPDHDHPAKVVSVLQEAVRTGVRSPVVLRACAALSLVQRDTTASATCAMLDLAIGHDSTLVLMQLAAISFAHHDTAGGTSFFQSAVTAAHDSLARDAVRWQLQWLLTPDEASEWVALKSGDRGRWVRDRLAGRDIRDGRPSGARLAEHFARLAYVETEFRLHVPRQLEDKLRRLPAVKEATGGCGDVKSCREPGGAWAEEWREYTRWEVDFDDRGVVWMRFGKPDRLIPWECPGAGCPIDREAWVYHIDGRELLVSFENEAFDGSVQPTRLVVGVLGSYFCDIDAERCRLTSLSQADYIARGNGHVPAMPMVRQDQIEVIRREDLLAISDATTHDDNSPRGKRNIGVTARLYHVWDPSTAAPLALVAYAIAAHDLATTPLDTTRSADVTLRLLQWDPVQATRLDTALTASVPVTQTTSAVTGLLIGRSATATSAWNLVVTQGDSRLGRAFEDPASPLATGSVVLSDLVLGNTGEALSWRSHGTTAPINTTGAIDRARPASVFYQVKSDAAVAGRTSFFWYRSTDTKEAKAVLTVAYDSHFQPGINEAMPGVDFSRLSSGDYRLVVRITATDGRVIAQRSARVTLR